MIKKYYWAMAVMAAFVAGTIATATPVFAPPPEDDGEGGWKAAIDNLPMTFYIVQGDELPETVNIARISCDEGDLAVGGGGNSNGAVMVSEPMGLGTWGIISETGSEAFRASVVCADFAPVHETNGT